MKKRMLSLLIALVMVLGLLPTVALAEESALVNVKNENELLSAMNNVDIEMLSLDNDITLDAPLVIERSMKINGNGHTISMEPSHISSTEQSLITVSNS